jgi:hypothetical protein
LPEVDERASLGRDPRSMAVDTMYYALDCGIPAIWEPDHFPHVVGGAVIYDMEKFAHEATPVSKVEFERLVALREKAPAT